MAERADGPVPPPQRRPRATGVPREPAAVREQEEVRRRRLGLVVRRAHLARRREVLLHLTRS